MKQKQAKVENIRRREILHSISADFEISRGTPQPFGAQFVRGGINFAVYTPHAKFVTLVLFTKCHTDILMEFPLDPDFNRTGHVWHAMVRGLDSDIRYGFRVVCEKKTQECIKEIVLLDPYSRSTCGGETWGAPLTVRRNNQKHTFRLSQVVENTFDWEQDRAPRIPLKDSIIYELQVRGFTRHPSSGVNAAGTFAGLIEKIPYLKDLGVTAVELMPVTDFDETYPGHTDPKTGQTLLNLWGYDPISFFAPKAAFAQNSSGSGPLDEFRRMVKAFHEAGMEVILDMVFNHTGEGGKDGPIYHFKGLDHSVYYLEDADRHSFLNYSGCGNTLNCNHPVVRDLILDSLRYWVTEMHVDGFRFDLASILGRGRDGSVLSNPPLIERIAEDPILANSKLIAEAWDAAGLYQVGDFPHFQRWMEWNGRFRDDVRKFIRGDKGLVPTIATRLAGSADLYQDDGREPFHSVNFVTCHDGFTLADLVSYNNKHNEANGEENRDGSDVNFSWNCGTEGPDTNPEIIRLRRQQMRNFAAILLLAQGVPMLLAGDEFARTQQGNNNAYCQDNEISWVDWTFKETNQDLHRFFKELIALRKNEPRLRRTRFEVENIHGRPEMIWHGVELNRPDWSEESRCLALEYPALTEEQSDLFIMLNMGEQERVFQLPPLEPEKRWKLRMDTAQPAPNDIFADGEEENLPSQTTHRVSARSIVLLTAR